MPPRKKQKNPPIFSHEFVIQNHADILACLAILIVAGLISEGSAKISRLFISLQYEIKSDDNNEEPELLTFERGILDIFTIIFYAIIIAIFHAVIQEYGIDKITKKFHLSKTKNSRFSESGQILVWSVLSATAGFHLLIEDGLISDTSVSLQKLWEGYPHTILSWENKLFMISQIAYWVHMYPELYFQKVRKDEVWQRVQYYTLHLIFISGAYILHYWRVSIVLMALHYIGEALFHFSRLCYFADKTDISKHGYSAWGVVFPTVRFLTLGLSILVFWFGLASAKAQQGLDFASGCYNSMFLRIVSISSVAILQIWLMWPYIQLQIRYRNEEREAKQKVAAIKQKQMNKKAGKKSASNGDVSKNKQKTH